MITLIPLMTILTIQVRFASPLPPGGPRAQTATTRPPEEVERMRRLGDATAKLAREAEPLLAAGENARAERLLQAILSDYPRLVPAKSLLAEALVRQGRDAEALSILLDLQGRNGIWSEGNAVRIARLRARLGQVAASRADWSPQIVMRYIDGMPEVRSSLPSVTTRRGLETAWSLAAGYLTDLHGDGPGAAYYYGRALILDPANAFVNLKMGDLELRSGKAASAISRYALAARGAGRLKEQAERQGAIARSVAGARAGAPKTVGR